MRPTRKRENAAGVGRRSVLLTIGGSIALGALASEAEGGTASHEEGEYVIVQGDECVPVVPLSGDRTVEELYDLRIPDQYVGDNGATDPGSGPYFQSNGTRDLQRVDTTITFLYDGPDGLSLVVVHDSPGEENGGSVSWTLEGVPSGAAWVVKDDLYIDPDTGTEINYDNWTVDGSEHVVDWTWGSAGTDGGALRPLEDEFSIVLSPAFNEQAALWGQHYAEDPITDWQVLSFPDGRSKPERTSLALDGRVTIRAGACDEDDSEGTIADSDDDRREDSGKDDGDEEKEEKDKDGKDEKDEETETEEEKTETETEEEKTETETEEEKTETETEEKETETEEKETDKEDEDKDKKDEGDKETETEEEKTGTEEEDKDEKDEETETETETETKDEETETEEEKEGDDDDEDDEKDDSGKGRGRGNGRDNGHGNDR